jgi:hypothetical protein
MKMLKGIILPVLLSTVWISISEFFRNEFLLKTYWVKHYEGLGLVFPSTPVNGAVWGIWSLVFAIVIFLLAKKFSLLQTTVISWLAGFVMMWLVIGNMNVLPFSILWYAVPLSLLEAFVATWIVKRFQN